MEAIKNAQANVIAIGAKRCIQNALYHDVPAAAGQSHRPGEEVLIYSEVNKGMGCSANSSFQEKTNGKCTEPRWQKHKNV